VTLRWRLVPPGLGRPLLAGVTFSIASWAFVAFTPVFRHWLSGDARTYENWGSWMASHLVPYRDFSVEYPPGSLPMFVVPTYLHKLAGYHGTYFFWLRIEILVLSVVTLVVMARALAQLGASRRHAYLALCVAGVAPAVLGPNAYFHYDVWPALLAVCAVALMLAGRDVLACAFAAAGAVAKVYPLVLIPFALLELWRRGRWPAVLKGVGAALAVVIVVVGPFAVVAPHGITSSLHREASRPLEIESVGASFFAAAHEIGGLHLDVVRRAASHGLAGSAPDAVATTLAVGMLVALALIYLRYLRGPHTRDDLVIACAAAVAAYIVFSKVFSPQYLIWLTPLVPLVRGRRGAQASALLLAILGVTQIFEPYHYDDYWQLSTPWVIWAVVVRNLLVVGLLTLLVRRIEPAQAGGYTRAPERP
jgi:uncharacterized membrane protein